uniref:DUF2177 family protein n=1 Tax=viral metagenome TaxID=1070528 RepID=A0A6C0IG13_9ZZZZ
MFNFLMLISAIVFLSLDFIYLTLMGNYFKKQIQSIQGSELKINLLGAAICYVFLIFGINYFIIKPNKSVNEAFLLGIVIYGVYETTNYALLENWSILTVFLDTLWGGILFAVTTYIVNLFRKL